MKVSRLDSCLCEIMGQVEEIQGGAVSYVDVRWASAVSFRTRWGDPVKVAIRSVAHIAGA